MRTGRSPRLKVLSGPLRVSAVSAGSIVVSPERRGVGDWVTADRRAYGYGDADSGAGVS